MNKLYDLKLMLDAVKATRERWLLAIGNKTKEIISDNPKMDEKEAFSRALSNKEVNEEFQNLITLYGIIGTNSKDYSQALEPHVGEHSNVFNFPKKAA